ncbi:MAG: acyltransferase family protein [Oscillospiraceae bacterium]|nr:acyltransferase family protein [Oscillospiraceae bacterium]
MDNRKHYLDNLRAFTILLLFPFHIFMIYNNWGEEFYVRGEALLITSEFNSIVSFWMMPLLFAVAGISSRYALKKRSAGEYAKERVSKLLLPLIFGLLLVVPIQPYLAGLFYNGQANYFDSFTKVTDFSGYDGAFALAHLWFILFLFVISMVCLPFMIWYNNKGKGTLGDKVPLIFVILMGLLPCIGSLVKIGGQSLKSPTEYLAYFLLGYFFLSNDKLLEKLDRYRFLLLGLTVLYSGFTRFIIDGEFYEMASWLWILMILGMGRHYLNFKGNITAYLSKSSFGIYIFHQSWIVIAAFFIFKVTDSPVLQIPIIFLSSVVLTYLTYEVCKRVSVFSRMFGLKKSP